MIPPIRKSMKFEVRAGRITDVPIIAQFQLDMAMESEGIQLDRDRLLSGISAVVTDKERGLYFLAMTDGKCVGSLMLTKEWSDWNNGWYWWIQSVFVKPAYRGMRVFHTLYESVRQAAIEEHAIALRLYVDKSNVQAQHVYQKVGMQESHYLMYEEKLQHVPTIRPSTKDDIPRLLEIFSIARQFMAATGNPNQWEEEYPDVELLREDIESGDSYVVQIEDRVVATFLLRGGTDPTYHVIYDGEWRNDAPYDTIHRIASSGEVKGILHLVMRFALQHYDNIRIDTHRDNIVMQHAISKEGFLYCGIIFCRKRSVHQDPHGVRSDHTSQTEERPETKNNERMAYQYVKHA